MGGAVIHATRLYELIGLFVGLPILGFIIANSEPSLVFLLLALVGCGCVCVLWKDQSFKRKRLWQLKDAREHLLKSLRLFIPLASVIAAWVYFLLPELFLSLPAHQTEFWLVTLLIYPLISVIPQELIFRTYFFHRYKPLFPSKYTRLWVSSFLFGLAHSIYGNWIAVVGSWVCGLLFGYRYIQSRSTAIVVIEHTLWGSFIFTIGLDAFVLLEV